MNLFSKENIQAIFDKMGDKISPQFKELATEAFEKMSKGATLQEALGFTPENIKAIIRHADNLLQEGKYESALENFQIVHYLEPLRYEHLFSMAACYQLLGQTREALDHYQASCELALDDPVPHFHFAECLKKVGEINSAFEEYQKVIRIAKENENYKKHKEEAIKQCELLKPNT